MPAIPQNSPVIPAKAGIQSLAGTLSFRRRGRLDSRFHGNDDVLGVRGGIVWRLRAEGQSEAAHHPPENENQREQERENKATCSAVHGYGCSPACSEDGVTRRLIWAAR